MHRTLAFALLVLASAPLSFAQTPSTTRLIPYAGSALDASGIPMSGQVAVTFELYEEQEGGSPLWRETQRVQADDRGRYLVYLGTRRPLPQVAFTQERARWLAVTINDHPLPRVMLVSVPYALRAADADTLGGHPASSFVRSRADGRLETSAGVIAEAPVDGSGVPGQLAKFSSATTVSSSVISESATNRIGVGLPDPTGGGVVDSVFTIRNFDNNTGFAVLNQLQQRRFALNTVANGGWSLYDGANGAWNLGLRQAGGSVSIGGFDPLLQGKFSVWNTGIGPAASFIIPTPSQTASAVYISSYGTGPAIYAEKVNNGGVALRVAAINNTSDLILGTAGAAGNTFRVSNGGAVFAASYTLGGADFAEEIEPAENFDVYEPGDVLTISEDRNRTVARSIHSYSPTVIGVYSTRPGVIASPHHMDDPRHAGALPVAMIGIVPCKVSAENGAIRRGDLLVTSSTPGHAMKGTDPSRMTGAIVGKALEPFASGTGKILVAVTLQ